MIDHDEKTGLVRGLLCHHCNVMLGHARDDIPTLESAVEYLELAHCTLSKEAETWLSRWARVGYCCYIRPVSVKLIDPRRKHELMWVVSVEFFTGNGHKQVRAEGYDLSETIIGMSGKIPKPQSKKRRRGWLRP
jgi:hypothetical protein